MGGGAVARPVARLARWRSRLAEAIAVLQFVSRKSAQRLSLNDSTDYTTVGEAQDSDAHHLVDTDPNTDADADDIDPDDPPGEVDVPAGRSPGVALVASTDPLAAGTGVGADGWPPANTADAVAWWRAHHPNMPVREICAKVGRSERTVRRILDGLPPRPVLVDDDAGDRAADAGGPRPRINRATVTPLADSVTSG